MDVKYVDFRKREVDMGGLVFIEGENDIPFSIRRVYYIYGVPADGRRGFHAHKELRQALICVNGSCKILLDDGREQTVVELKDPACGILIERPIWREMYDFTPDAVLLVLASERYDEADYIRDYGKYIQFLKESRT